MSTNDVPGFNPKNLDTLHGNCWAEHADGTLIHVLATENGTVLFDLYDPSTRPPTDYRDAMPQAEFEKKFSWNAKDPKSVKFTWHDKTVFPWDRILRYFNQGVRAASVRTQLSDAARVRGVQKKHMGKKKTSRSRARAMPVDQIAEDLDEAGTQETVAQQIARERALTGQPVAHADVAHRAEREVPKGTLATRIRDRIQSAIDKLRPGRGG